MYALIRKKRDGGTLSRQEIHEIIVGYVAGTVPDYQVSALLMAIFFRGMSDRETADLTEAMVASGETIDLGALPGISVDKHSTGGVGDKTTLVLAPLLAAAGLTVAKMSGRGLGHTGGTLDKLESIPGFRTDLTASAMIAQAREVGLAVVAQSGDLVPADGLLYALRDVTATVDSLPLIASSIMSKKLAAGAHAMVLDVKTGSGAFMARHDDAFALARAMVAIGSVAGRRVVALVTEMAHPLGRAIGNALEVTEAVETLRGGGAADLRALSLALGSQLLPVARRGGTVEEARAELADLLSNGSALARFAAFVEAQGGDPRVVDDPEAILPRAQARAELSAEQEGYVASINALAVGDAARALGAGRARKGEAIDPAAGVVLLVGLGARIAVGQPWATLLAADDEHLAAGRALLGDALRVSAAPVEPPPLIYGVVHPDGREERTARSIS
jgi:pyrimidine-nucleoside phosphorylase